MKTKKIFARLLACVFFLGLTAGEDLKLQDVNDAVKVSLQAQMLIGMPAAMGAKVKGVEYEDNVFSYEDCQLGACGLTNPPSKVIYQTVSGKVLLDGTDLIFDVELNGGPVSTLKYRVNLNTVKKVKAGDLKTYKVNVTANGKIFEYDFAKFKE